MFEQPKDNPAMAAALMLLACAFIAGSTLLAKVAAQGTYGPALHPLQVSFGRFLFAFLALAGFWLIRRPSIVKPDYKRHIARSIAGWLGVSLMFAAAAMIPLSDATAISFLNPVFAMALAVIFLGERIGVVRIFAALLALIGSVILLRPGTGSFELGGLFALGAALLFGAEITIIKYLSGKEGPFQILFLNNMIAVVIASFAASFVWQHVSGVQWVILAGVGLTMMAAQICYVNSIARADAGFVTPFTYVTLIFATLYDLALFGVIPDSISYLGSALILSGAALLAWREGRKKRAVTE